jgi:beta-glucosidase
LKGFKRVSLQPGETKSVTLELNALQLAYWDSTRKAFVIEGAANNSLTASSSSMKTRAVVEKSRVEISVGSSSSDIKLAKVIEVRDY